MKTRNLLCYLVIYFTSLPISYAQEVIEEEPKLPGTALKPLPFIAEKVTATLDDKNGRVWIIDDAFATKHKAKPLGHDPFMVTLMPRGAEVGKVLYHTRPKVADLIRFSQITKDSKVAESIRFTTLSMPDTIPMDLRLAQSAALIENQMIPNFAKGHKDLTIGQRYKTKIGPYHGAVILGKLTLQDDSILFIKLVAILRENNSNGVIAMMILNPATGKKEDLQLRMTDGFAQRILHSFRFIKKKAPAPEEEKVEVEIKDKE